MRKAVFFGITAIMSLLFSVALVHAETQVGVKTGDWVKCELTASDTPSEDTPQWVKVECLFVTGTTVTLKITTHMSSGAEQDEIVILDVASGEGNATFPALIPANSKIGDTIQIVGYGSLTIEGEKTGVYVGVTRTVVYASFSQNEMQYDCSWDKQTGVLVEITLTQGSAHATFKATSTNLWQASSSPLTLPTIPIELLSICSSVALAIAMVAAAVILTRRKRS